MRAAINHKLHNDQTLTFRHVLSHASIPLDVTMKTYLSSTKHLNKQKCSQSSDKKTENFNAAKMGKANIKTMVFKLNDIIRSIPSCNTLNTHLNQLINQLLCNKVHLNYKVKSELHSSTIDF